MNNFLQGSRIAFQCLHNLAVEPIQPDQTVAQDEAMFRLACRHRVVGLWASNLVPAWKQYAYSQAAYSALCASEAEQIYEYLRQTVPDIGLIKGPALAMQAWPQSGLRHFDDLDFRCGKKYFHILRLALESLGYRPEIDDHNRQENYWHYGWGVSFVRDDGLRVEFNHRMFPPHYPKAVRLSVGALGIWNPITLDQYPVLTLSPAAHLLFCSMHAIWHGWERLGWVADIAGLIIRSPDTITEARVLAGKAGFPRRALDTACRVANGLFGPLPGWPDQPPDGGAEQQEAESLLMHPQSTDRFRQARHLHHRLYSGRERMVCSMRRLLIPGDSDFRRWSFSANRRSWYWVLRPLRLLTTIRSC